MPQTRALSVSPPRELSAVRRRCGVTSDDLTGWRLDVDVDVREPMRIVRLTFVATDDDVRLRAKDLRAIDPAEILAAVREAVIHVEWSTSDRDDDELEHGLERLPSGRFRRDDAYLRRLSTVALRIQGRKLEGGARGYLADLFDRTPSQIRDDLVMAERRHFLAPTEFGRVRKAGSRLHAQQEETQ